MVLALVARGPKDLRLEEREHSPWSGPAVEVQIALGGICGSDLHYFHEGKVGESVIREPLVLGHELVGTVVGVRPGEGGEAGELPSLGTRVAIDPSRPCGLCDQCRSGLANLCRAKSFLGSAATVPHTQGGFCDSVVVSPAQCLKIPDDVSFESAVFAEPLAVALHAIGRAGSPVAREVLVTGAGQRHGRQHERCDRRRVRARTASDSASEARTWAGVPAHLWAVGGLDGRGPPIPLIPTQGVLGTTVHVAPRPLVALGASHVSLSTRRSTLRVSCSGAPCRGSVELITRVAIRSHAGTRSGRRFEQVVVARGTFALAAGRGASVVLHLTAAGRARATAARRHRLATDLVVSLAGGRTLTRTVLVR